MEPTRSIFAPISELYQNRNLIKALVSTSYKAAYHGLLLGQLWKYLEPLMYVTTYYVFIVIIRGRASDDVPILAIVLSGLMFYDLCRRIIVDSPSALKRWQSIILTTPTPLSVIIATSFCAQVVASMPLWIVGMGVVFYVTDSFSLYALLVPFLVALFIFVIFPLSVILSYFGSYVQDLGNLMGLLGRLLLFLSPVLFPLSQMAESFRFVMLFNPLTVFIESLRDLLWRQQLPQYWEALLIVTVVGMLLWVAALMLSRRLGRHVVKVL